MPLHDRQQLIGRDVAQLLHDAAGRPFDPNQVDELGAGPNPKWAIGSLCERKLLLPLISWTSFLLGKARSGVTVMNAPTPSALEIVPTVSIRSQSLLVAAVVAIQHGRCEVVDDKHVQVAVAVVIERQETSSLRRVGHAHAAGYVGKGGEHSALAVVPEQPDLDRPRSLAERGPS